MQAYSYIRFSSARQSKGGSLERQTTATAEFCRRKGWTLSQTTFADLGLSAFKGANFDGGNLGLFLEAVKNGSVPKGSVLIVESLDRLSRNEPTEALQDIFGKIIRAGVDIATLVPERHYSHPIKPYELIELVIILIRANEESARKSGFSNSAWRKVREGKTTFKGNCPVWLTWDGSKHVLNDKAKTIRKVFEVASTGIPCASVCRELNKAGVATLGNASLWSDVVVRGVLRNRAVIGDYAAKRRDGFKRVATGDIVEGCFPAVVAKPVFWQVQKVLDSNKMVKGRGASKGINLFAGLLRDARDNADNGSMVLWRNRLGSLNAQRGKKIPYVSFDYTTFEVVMLETFRELTAQDIFPSAPQVSNLEGLTSELATVKTTIDKVKARLESGESVDAMLDSLARLDARRKTLQVEIEKERAATHRKEETDLTDLQTVLDKYYTLRGDERDQARSRIAGKIRSLVSVIHCWFAANGRNNRKAIVEVSFRSGIKRTVWIRQENESLTYFVWRDDDERGSVFGAKGLDRLNPRATLLVPYPEMTGGVW